jgi:membrane fusion protein (multidrug efflux system)
VDLRPQASGAITRYTFREGETVEKGQVLFVIDDAPYRAEVAQAEAALDKARAERSKAAESVRRGEDLVIRLQPLAKTEAIPRQQALDAEHELAAERLDLEARQADIRSARASLSTAEIKLQRTIIRAPFSGVIGRSRLVVGGLASSSDGEPLATLSQSDPLQFVFPVSDADYLKYFSQLAANAPARDAGSARSPAPTSAAEHSFSLILADGSTFPASGRFYAVSRSAEALTDTFEVSVLFPNKDGRLRPGQYGEVRSDVDSRRGALLVPINAVMQTQGVKTVWVVGAHNKVAERRVEARDRLGNAYVVESGLRPGELVVVGGEQKLNPDDAVKPHLVRADDLGLSTGDALVGASSQTAASRAGEP